MALYFDLMEKNFPFTLESIGTNWYQEDIIRPNGYPYYHWLQTEKGLGEIQFADQKISLPAGCGILISPFYPHHYYRKSPDEWRTSFVTISGKFSNQISEILKHENYLFIPDAHYFKSWTEDMLLHCQKRDYSSLDYSVACYDFLLHLKQKLTVEPQTENKLYTTYLKPAIAFIETHFAEDFSIEELAQHVFITPQYLTRLFQRFFHMTSSEYLSQLRIKKSKELLITKKDTEIQVISQMVGFKSSSHFIATFKKATGYTPMAFRDLYI